METEVKKKKKSSGRRMQKWHKWVGIIFTFFIFMFALSGIFLNHREAISSLDVPRSILPGNYRYDRWNNGSVKSTIKLSPDTILMYGNSGIWLTDTLHTSFSSYVKGMKSGADNTNVGNIIVMDGNDIFAATTFDLYKLNKATDTWENLSDKVGASERYTDIAAYGDSLILMSRSHIYTSKAPYISFTKQEIQAPEGYKKETSWFRTLWTLHSGELFGLPGKIVVDIVGILTIILCITGVILFFCPKIIKRKKKKGGKARKSISLFKGSLKWHNKLGAIFIVLFLIVCISGMFLRPPLMIAIIRGKTKPVPGSVLNSDNPWYDKLRMIRYDAYDSEWILYSSEGFFILKSLDDQPVRMMKTPPVSVMGVNVFNQIDSTRWVVGSFSGIYYWNKETGESLNCYTGKPAERGRPSSGAPSMTTPVSGYSDDFDGKRVVFEYGKGAKTLEAGKTFAEMPNELQGKGRMSLWHLCLEIHVGRIYAPILPDSLEGWFIFISGILFLIILISGYIVYRKRHKKRKRKK